MTTQQRLRTLAKLSSKSGQTPDPDWLLTLAKLSCSTGNRLQQARQHLQQRLQQLTAATAFAWNSSRPVRNAAAAYATHTAIKLGLMALVELELWIKASILRLNRIAANGPHNAPDGVETAGMTNHPQDGAATLRHPQSTMDHGDGFEADAAAARLEHGA